jgi:small-conductance mechanosensitive channel
VDVLRLPASAGGPVRKLAWTALTLIWMTTVIRVTATVVESLVAREPEDSTGLGKGVAPLAENAVKVLAVASAVGAVLMIWDVDVTPFVASAGLLGAGLAFAAKDSLSNLFGGISIFLDKPYKIGDYVVLDKGERGEVTAIGLRSTRILTRDNVQITIPNSIIAGTKVINESAPMPNYRVRVPVGVAYGSDIDLVEEILVGVARANANVVDEPAPRARFRRFGDSALEYELLCWAHEPSLRGLTVHEINREIYLQFAERGVSIPFPQRDVHIHREKGGPESGA